MNKIEEFIKKSPFPGTYKDYDQKSEYKLLVEQFGDRFIEAIQKKLIKRDHNLIEFDHYLAKGLWKNLDAEGFKVYKEFILEEIFQRRIADYDEELLEVLGKLFGDEKLIRWLCHNGVDFYFSANDYDYDTELEGIYELRLPTLYEAAKRVLNSNDAELSDMANWVLNEYEEIINCGFPEEEIFEEELPTNSKKEVEKPKRKPTDDFEERLPHLIADQAEVLKEIELKNNSKFEYINIEFTPYYETTHMELNLNADGTHVIDLSLFSRVKELPESIGNLSTLERLICKGSLSSWRHLKELPSSIGELKNLKRLYLVRNRLTELPESLLNCKNLEYIDLTMNPYQLLESPVIQNLKNRGVEVRLDSMIDFSEEENVEQEYLGVRYRRTIYKGQTLYTDPESPRVNEEEMKRRVRKLRLFMSWDETVKNAQNLGWTLDFWILNWEKTNRIKEIRHYIIFKNYPKIPPSPAERWKNLAERFRKLKLKNDK